MTEKTWLACLHPRPLLKILQSKASDRKLRLFACACCRRIWLLLTIDESRTVIEGLERWVDGLTSEEFFENAFAVAQKASWCAEGDMYGAEQLSEVDRPAYLRAWGSFEAAEAVEVATADNAQSAAYAYGSAAEAVYIYYYPTRTRKDEYAAQSALIRCIFSNPFRPVSLDPAWLTPTVTQLAEAIYADRAFDRLPVLADALEEAGCADAAILKHCRQPGEHVRGCWVVDLLLGKQ